MGSDEEKEALEDLSGGFNLLIRGYLHRVGETKENLQLAIALILQEANEWLDAPER